MIRHMFFFAVFLSPMSERQCKHEQDIPICCCVDDQYLPRFVALINTSNGYCFTINTNDHAIRNHCESFYVLRKSNSVPCSGLVYWDRHVSLARHARSIIIICTHVFVEYCESCRRKLAFYFFRVFLTNPLRRRILRIMLAEPCFVLISSVPH